MRKNLEGTRLHVADMSTVRFSNQCSRVSVTLVVREPASASRAGGYTHIRKDIGATRLNAGTMQQCGATRRDDGSFKRRYPRGS